MNAPVHKRSWRPRAVDKPQIGFFRLPLVKGGPKVAAAITRRCPFLPPQSGLHPDQWFEIDDWAHRPDRLVAVVNGELRTHPIWLWRIWHHGEEIAPSEYAYMLRVSAWAVQHAPDSPEANPLRPIAKSTGRIYF